MQQRSIETSALAWIFEFDNAQKAYNRSERMIKRDIILDGKNYMMKNMNFKNPFIVLLDVN
jgi:hypothetical protein